MTYELSLKKQNRDIILSNMILVITALFIGIRTYFQEPISDDLLYGYILDANPLGMNEYTYEVQNFSDAIKSQSVQYFHSNGRTLIHILVQMFAGPWGHTAFSIFNTILAFAVMFLFANYVFPKTNRFIPIFSMGISILYLYLFQDNSGLWYSIAGSLNYLFPMLLVLGYLLILNKIKESKPATWFYPILIIYGLVTGWCQEAYSLPLAGGMFLYLIFRFRKANTATWIFAVSLWIGTALLVFAPGNFVRMGMQPPLYIRFLKGIQFLIGTYTFWLLLIGLLVVVIFQRNKLKGFVFANQLNILILTISILFGLIANSLPQSFNGVSFYCAILLGNLLGGVEVSSQKSKRICGATTWILLTIVGIHQIRIIQASEYIEKINHQFVEDYKASDSGIMRIPDYSFASDVRPYVARWFEGKRLLIDWGMLTLDKHYSRSKKPITLLHDIDYLAFSDRIAFEKRCETVRGCSDVFHGEEYLWMPQDKLNPGDTLKIFFNPGNEDFILRMKLWLLGNKASNNQEIIVSDSLEVKGKDGLVGIKISDNSGISRLIIKKSSENEKDIDTHSGI